MRRYSRMKLEYTGSWIRIVVEVFHRDLPHLRRRTAFSRRAEEFRRRMLRKVIHRIGETDL